MFEAGSIVFRLQSIGKQVFQKDLDDVDAAAKKVGASTTAAGKSTEDLGKKQETAAEKTKRLAREQAIAAQRAQELSAAQATVGRTLLGVGTTLIAITALAVRSAIGWESAWAGVTKTIDATPEQLDDIEEGLRDLSKVLPSSHDEIAAVAEAAGQLGVASKDVVSFTRTMVDLGETTNLTSDEAATAIAQLMNIMQTAPEDVSRLGSALVDLGNNGASTEKDIIFMAQRIAGAGKIIGLTEAEVLSFANALASAGIEVEAGGSAISRIMIDIAKQVSTNGADLEKWASVAGMTTAEFAKKFKGAPAQAINDFILGLGKMNAAGGDVFTTLSDLGQSDIRVSNALLSMANAGDLLTGSLEIGTKAWKENVALQTEAEKRYATTEAKLQIMQNSINDAAIDLGSVFLPALVDAAGGLAALADGLASMPPWLQELIAGGGLAVGAIALIGGTALLAVPKIIEMRAALALLATESPNVVTALGKTATFLKGPWALAVAAAVIGVKLLGDYIDSLQASSEELTNSLVSAKDAKEIFDTAMKGKDVKYFASVRRDLGDLDAVLETASRQATNWWERIGNSSNFAAESALKEVGVQLAALTKSDLPGAQRAFAMLAAETNGSDKQLWRLLSTMPDYKDALVEQATAQGINVTTDDEALNKKRLLALANGEGAAATDRATAAVEAQAAAQEAAIEASEEWRKEIAELDASFVDITGAYDSVVEKNKSVAESTANATKSTKDSWEDFYDGVTVAVGDYLNELQKQVDAQNNWESNMVRMAGRVSQGTLDELARMGPEGAPLVAQLVNASDDELIRMESLFAERGAGATNAFASELANAQAVISAAAAQLGTEAAMEIAGKLADGTSTVQQIMDEYKLKIESTDPMVTVNTSGAHSEIDNFVNAYQGKSITMKMFLDTSGGNKAAAAAAARYSGQALQYFEQADGGKVNFYANGGRENHIAQFARAGTMRVWAEPETGGEWYIPASPAKRQRSTQVLAAAASEFGYQLVPAGAQTFADGGRAGSPAAAAPRGGNTFNIYETASADATAQAVARRQNRIGAV